MNREALPVYIQIAEELRQNINQGIYQVGEKLPTESQLSERFQVNRHTLRRSIGVLKNEGLVRVDQGRGTFVVARPIKYAIGKRVRLNQNLKLQGLQPSYKLLEMIEISADINIAKKLEIGAGEPVVLMERLAFADGLPISVTSSYFPLELFPEFTQESAIILMQEKGSISLLLKELYNCDHIRLSTHVYARIVKHQDALLLEVPLNHPILLVESINIDQDRNIIEYGITRFRGDRMELVFETD